VEKTVIMTFGFFPGKKHLHGRGEDTNILLKNIDRNPNVVS